LAGGEPEQGGGRPRRKDSRADSVFPHGTRGTTMVLKGSGMTNYNTPTSDKSKKKALKLCLFGLFGLAGLHCFYVGRLGRGLLYLLTFGLFGLGTLCDLVDIAFGAFRDNVGMPLRR
jgi:restriction system protein